MPARSGVGADPAAMRGEGGLPGRLASFRYEWAVYAVLVVGFVARLVALGEYPAGFNQDEASAAYDAYSILKTGYDRNGQFPSGTPHRLGERAKCTVLLFEYAVSRGFRLDVWAFRLPMALIGCLSLFAFWRLLLAMTDRKTAPCRVSPAGDLPMAYSEKPLGLGVQPVSRPAFVRGCCSW